MKIAKLPDVAARLKPSASRPSATRPTRSRKSFAADIVRWGDLVKSANIKIEQ